MSNISKEQKVAVLLNALGPEAAEVVLNHVEINRANRIQSQLSQLSDHPTEMQTVEDVLDDFERFFKFALEAANTESYWSHLLEKDQIGDEAGRDDPKKTIAIHRDSDEDPDDEMLQAEFEEFEPGDDVFRDLNRLNPVQVAAALKEDDPRTIAIVLGCLRQSKAAECIELLPASIQGDVMSRMMAKSSIPPTVLKRIVSITVEKGMEIRKPEKPQPQPDEKVASVLRELPRNIRARIMDHLKENNSEEIEDLQKMLYVFEDILNYDDRSIQKIMAEVEKTILIVALQDCPEAISEKIFSNLSKRAKTSLLEELEFAGKESEEAVTEARAAIANTIAELDQSEQIRTL